MSATVGWRASDERALKRPGGTTVALLSLMVNKMGMRAVTDVGERGFVRWLVQHGYLVEHQMDAVGTKGLVYVAPLDVCVYKDV